MAWLHLIWHNIPTHVAGWVLKIQIARFMGPACGPPGSCRPHMGPMLVLWTLLSGKLTRQEVKTLCEDPKTTWTFSVNWIIICGHWYVAARGHGFVQRNIIEMKPLDSYFINRGYPAERVLSAMRKHAGWGPFGRIPSKCGAFRFKVEKFVISRTWPHSPLGSLSLWSCVTLKELEYWYVILWLDHRLCNWVPWPTNIDSRWKLFRNPNWVNYSLN